MKSRRVSRHNECFLLDGVAPTLSPLHPTTPRFYNKRLKKKKDFFFFPHLFYLENISLFFAFFISKKGKRSKKSCQQPRSLQQSSVQKPRQ